MFRSDRCGDPIGTEGGAPTGSRSKLRLKPLSKRSSFGRLLLEGPSTPRWPRSTSRSPPWRPPRYPPSWPPSAEGGHKRAVLAAQYDYVWIRLVYVVVELGVQLLLHDHLLRTSPFLREDRLLRFLPSTYVSAWK